MYKIAAWCFSVLLHTCNGNRKQKLNIFIVCALPGVDCKLTVVEPWSIVVVPVSYPVLSPDKCRVWKQDHPYNSLTLLSPAGFQPWTVTRKSQRKFSGHQYYLPGWRSILHCMQFCSEGRENHVLVSTLCSTESISSVQCCRSVYMYLLWWWWRWWQWWCVYVWWW